MIVLPVWLAPRPHKKIGPWIWMLIWVNKQRPPQWRRFRWNPDNGGFWQMEGTGSLRRGSSFILGWRPCSWTTPENEL